MRTLVYLAPCAPSDAEVAYIFALLGYALARGAANTIDAAFQVLDLVLIVEGCREALADSRRVSARLAVAA